MKKLVLFIISLIACSVPAQTFMERLHFEVATGAGMKSKYITPVDFSFKANVDLTSGMYVFVSSEGNQSFYKNDDVKTYYNGESFGGGLGVKLLGKKSASHALDVRMKVLTSIGNADWKRTSYDVNVAWYLKSNVFSPVVEIGYRYIDSLTGAIGNYGNVYLSVGIRY